LLGGLDEATGWDAASAAEGQLLDGLAPGTDDASMFT
jgi:hypothetical protein